MRTLILANRTEVDAGFVGEALLPVDAHPVVLLREDAWALPEPGSFDLVLSLGSEWSVYWDRISAEVEREAALLRQAVADGKPVLGLCFGGQILAHALGGRVSRAPQPELGWYSVDSDLPDLIPPGPYVQWHSDRFEIPPGARQLARSERCPQAFALGSALGLQFHPEATPEVVRRWCVGGLEELARAGVDPVTFIAEADTQLAASRARAFTIVESFLSGAFAVPATT